MKYSAYLLALSILLCVSCGTAETKTASPDSTTPEKSSKPGLVQLVSDKDPVCGMTVGTETADTTLLNGKVYGFCSDDCKETFLKDSAAVAHH